MGSSSAIAPDGIHVIHSSDAGADDYVASWVLAVDPSVTLETIIITNADCVPEYALSAYEKFVQFINQPISFGLSTSRPWNQFPWLWRADTIRLNEIECFAPYDIKPKLTFRGDQLFIEALENAPDHTVHVVATGPLTTLADILKKFPHLKNKIRSLYWMGGAIDVPGNITDAEIDKKALNDKAEWNVFADAFAADWIFRNTSFNIYLIPLDLTNYAQITPKFLDRLCQSSLRGSKYADFILKSYQAVCDLGLYSMWDVVTAVVLTHPELFESPVLMRLKVSTLQVDHGAITRDNQGRKVHVYLRFKNDDIEPFHDYILELASPLSKS